MPLSEMHLSCENHHHFIIEKHFSLSSVFGAKSWCVLHSTGAVLKLLLTNWGQCGSGQLHAGAVVQRASVGAGADGSAGAQQTQPLAFLPVAGVGHWQPQGAEGGK